MARQLSPVNLRHPERPHASASAVAPNPVLSAHAESLPIDEIGEQFPREWVLVRITALDQHQHATHGQLISHSRSQKKVCDAMVQAHREDPTARTYYFYGGRVPATVEEWRERLAEG